MTEAVQIALVVAVGAAIPPTVAIVMSHRAQTKTLTHIADVTNSKWDAAQERIAVLQNELVALKRIRKKT